MSCHWDNLKEALYPNHEDRDFYHTCLDKACWQLNFAHIGLRAASADALARALQVWKDPHVYGMGTCSIGWRKHHHDC